MQKEIIERIRFGHKLCMSGVSAECVEIADVSSFVGRVCRPCSRHISQQKYADKKERSKSSTESDIQEVIDLPEVVAKPKRKPKKTKTDLIDPETGDSPSNV